MVQPRIRDGKILPHTEQPTGYLLAYADALVDAASQDVNGVLGPLVKNSKLMLGQEINRANVHMNTVRDILQVLMVRESWNTSGDGGYK